MTIALLVLVALYLVWNAWKTRGWSARIAATREHASVSRIYYGWAMSAWIGLGLPAICGMILLRRDLFAMPPEFAGVWPVTGLPIIGAILVAMVVGMALNIWVALRRRRLGNGPPRVLVFPLPKPMSLAETPGPIWLAVSAGVSEDLFFRQFLPLLLVLVSGSLWLAVPVSAAAYAILYRYRGPRGMVATALMGAGLSLLYLLSGSLLVTMAFHALVVFNRLVIDPIAFWPRSPA